MKNLKKIIAVILIALMLGSTMLCFAETDETETVVETAEAVTETAEAEAETAEAEAETAEITELSTESETVTTAAPAEKMKDPFVYVTVYDGKKVAAVNVKVKKSDEDKDGAWTINDALIAVHKEKCKNGYATEEGAYGLTITKLWGIENGGSYGYYNNNVMCMSLKEELSEVEADHLYAFVYSDAVTWSDAYSFFDQYEITGKPKEKATLTLKYMSFDESYNPVEVPLAGAVITYDGKDTTFKTDENGVVEIELSSVNTVISAKKDGLTLIPPVCQYTVKESSAARLIIALIITAVIAAAAVCVILFNNKKRKKGN